MTYTRNDDKVYIMKSKKKLFEDIKEIFGLDISLKKGATDETYGKESFIYINWSNHNRQRDEVEARLELLGYAIDKNYWKDSQVSAIQVSYFKGWHWDE